MGDDRHPALGRACTYQRLFAVAAGALAGLALPPLGFPPLIWIALAALWDLAGDSPAAGAASGRRWGGLLWGAAAVLVSHRWLLWLHPLDWVGVPGPLSLPVCLTLWGACGLAGGLLVEGWLALARRGNAARPATAVASACLWGLAEVMLARGPLFWIGLGSSALPGDPALAGLAALGGAGLVAALQVLVGWCLWRLLRCGGSRRAWLALTGLVVLGSHLLGLAALAAVTTELDGELEGRSTGSAMVLAASNPAAAEIPLPPSASALAAPAAAERLLVLQPAIPTRRKFEAAQQRRLLQQLALAQERSAHGSPGGAVQSLLLPEGALALGQPLPEVAAVEVLSGGFRRQGAGVHSSLLRFAVGGRDPVGWVDKHRLVPFGEWVPLADLWSWSGLSAVGGLQPGPPDRLLSRPAGSIGVAICYEIADGTALARASRAGARWLLVSANLDPYPPLLQAQFLAMARLRAIETGRWLVSAANTGPSVLVDAAGRLRDRLPAGRNGSAVFSLRHRIQLTPYDRWGEMPLLFALVFALALLLHEPRKRRAGTGASPSEDPPCRR
jgi:apolipoprotein N-acyltransferase